MTIIGHVTCVLKTRLEYRFHDLSTLFEFLECLSPNFVRMCDRMSDTNLQGITVTIVDHVT